MEMRKVVLKLSILDNEDRRKVMKAVSSLSGIESIPVDINGGKMTVVGDVDPVEVVGKLKKQWSPQILTVGPAKEEGEKKEEKERAIEFVQEWQDYYRHPYYYYYNYHHPYYYKEYPSSCVIS